MSVQTIDPSTGEVLREFEFLSEAELETLIQESAEAFRHWRKVPLKTRLECVRVFAEGLQGGRLSLAESIHHEMGKPMREALGEVDKCVASCHALREHFPRWKQQLEYQTGNGYSVVHEPLGPLLGIMPWNFPLWQVVRFAVPAILCGNSILLKHAPNTWGTAEMISDYFRQTFPDGLYQNLQIDVAPVAKIIADARVRGVSLTGSRRAGQSVGQQAGAQLKKFVLELGGSDAYVILDDADLAQAAKVCAQARLVNTGQSCVAAKRFIVTKKNAEEFTGMFTAEMQAAKDLGPMARKDLRDGLHDQVQRSLKNGARKVLGGELPCGKGFFYPTSVLAGVRPGQAAFDEELFGPVGAVIEATNEEDAFRLANHTVYGLGGAIFSRDTERALSLAQSELDAGMIAINDFVRSDALAPFGGIKDSGLGRELGREGAFEFTNIKSIYMKP